MNYSSELPVFIEKYKSTLPCLKYDNRKDLSPKDKASLTKDYLCTFIPQQKYLSLKGSTELENKLEYLITNQKSISLVILGFPFKSTNQEKKCLSEEVDLGEYVGLITLHQLVKNIQLIHADTHCTIISDGLAYHIDDYDPAYEDIFNYHETMNNLVTHFNDLSFVSWKINDQLNSYGDLQKQVSSVPLENSEKDDEKRYQEMNAFVSTEFKCAHWENDVFLKKAQSKYTGTQQKQKLREQEIRALKNSLIQQRIKYIVPQLVHKGKQFSTLVSNSWPHYDECIRLSVHCDKNVIDISNKIPINLMYGYQGTPWHNAIVVNDKRNELEGFAKDILKIKLNLTTQTKKTLPVKTQHSTVYLSYITH